MAFEAFFVSTGLVALAEMGDKTQLLALLLAARFKKPLPIIVGIFLATIFNHAAAAWIGQLASDWLTPTVLTWILIASFIAMAVWMLIPDELDDEADGINRWQRFGVLGATFILFFLAEIGDKTQVATIALAARFNELIPVVMGTTLGMMIANVPAVFVGQKMAEKIPTYWIHRIAAGVFLVLALGLLFQQFRSILG